MDNVTAFVPLDLSATFDGVEERVEERVHCFAVIAFGFLIMTMTPNWFLTCLWISMHLVSIKGFV